MANRKIIIIGILLILLLLIIISPFSPWKMYKARSTARRYAEEYYSDNVKPEGLIEFRIHDYEYIQKFYDSQNDIVFYVAVYPSFIWANCTDTYFYEICTRVETERSEKALHNTKYKDCDVRIHMGNDFRNPYLLSETYDENYKQQDPFYWMYIKVPYKENVDSENDRNELMNCLKEMKYMPHTIRLEYADKTVNLYVKDYMSRMPD